MLKRLVIALSESLPWHNYLRAILTGMTIDYFTRYFTVIRILKAVANILKKDLLRLKVIDIGSGSTSPLNYYADTISIDIAPIPGIDVVADATQLPFRNESFDVAVVIDTLEHIDKRMRDIVIEEVCRVAKIIIVHTPLISKNGLFNARFYDYLLFKYLREKLNKHNLAIKYTYEHLKYDEPKLEELMHRGFRLLKVDHNAKVWYTIMKIQLSSKGFISRIVWFVFLSILKHIKIKPFWGGYLIKVKIKNNNEKLYSCI